MSSDLGILAESASCLVSFKMILCGENASVRLSTVKVASAITFFFGFFDREQS